MFMDISSEMIHSLLPIFLISVLNASTVSVGLIEGIAEALALITKTFSGVWSDRMGRRKALVFAGYAIGTFTKPLFAVAQSIGMVFTARFLDRMGKGIRGAPRDALVADATPAEIRGAAYGLRQSLDTVGACCGPLLATLFMGLTNGNYRLVFWVAVVPGLFALITIFFGVAEPAPQKNGSAQRPSIFRGIGQMGSAFWMVILIGSTFSLARFSEAFLLLRAQSVGLPPAAIPIILVLMNAFYALSAYPIGKRSDQMGRSGLLAAGLGILMISNLILAMALKPWHVAMGAVLWGIHMGLTQGLLAAMVADNAPPSLRGTAFGLFSFASGLAILGANVIAGSLWQWYGPDMAFWAGVIFSTATLLGYLALKSQLRIK